MTLTAIVILNYNNYEDTINCIDSVERYNTAPVKYIVVDNGSTRATIVERLHKFLSEKFAQSYLQLEEGSNIELPLPRMTFLVSKTNDGYAQGNNKGLRLAKADKEVGQILILNNDILFIEDIIPELLHYLDMLPQAGIVSPLLLKRDGKEIDYECARTNISNWELIITYLLMCRYPFGLLAKKREAHFLLKNNHENRKCSPIEIELPSGSCMLFKKELMKKINIFDGGTFLYFEENIIFKQEEKLGIKNYLIPNLKCIHLGASSTKKSIRSSIIKANIISTHYYLKNYGELTPFQNAILPIAILAMKFKYKMKILMELIDSHLIITK